MERPPTVKLALPTEEDDQVVPIIPGRGSFRNMVDRTKTSFRTFQGSRRGGYTVNGPKLQPDYPHEGIPLNETVVDDQSPPPVPTSPLPLTDDDSDGDFPPPPPPDSLPEEFLSAQSSPVQVLAVRPFEDEEQAIAPPPFDVEKSSPLSRSVNR